MALIKCPECGKELSDKAATCPNCGCPVQFPDSDAPVTTFKGINGTIVVFKNRVELQRGGLLGFGRGNSVIPINQISNIYVYNGNLLQGGYIQFLTSGESNSKDLNAALKADNAVTFHRGDRHKVADVKNKIYQLK